MVVPNIQYMAYISVTSAPVLTCILIQTFGIVLKFQFGKELLQITFVLIKHASH